VRTFVVAIALSCLSLLYGCATNYAQDAQRACAKYGIQPDDQRYDYCYKVEYNRRVIAHEEFMNDMRALTAVAGSGSGYQADSYVPGPPPIPGAPMPAMTAPSFGGGATLQSASGCPAGSYPWADSFGNRTCKQFGSGATTSVQGSLSNCPAGTHPWVDGFGNSVCQSFDSGQKLYDTSHGCPTGTHPWQDNFGNPICQAN